MEKNGTIQARVNKDLKKDVEDILEQLGMTSSQVINMLFSQIKLCGGLPFDVKLPQPNAETLKVFEETDKNINLVRHNSVEDIFKELDS